MSADANVLAVEERTIATPRGSRLALVLCPTGRFVLGAERLAELRADLKRASIDQQIVREVQRHRGVQMLIFRGVGANGAIWRFDDALDDDDADELGYLLTRSQLPTWRRLVASGVQLHLHTDWGVRETAACRRGTARLRQELSTGNPGPLERFDAYMLSYLGLFYSSDIEHVIAEPLRSQLGLVEQRAMKATALLESVPRDLL